MAYNRPYNPDELPRFAEPEQKGGSHATLPSQQAYNRPAPALPQQQQQQVRPQSRPQYQSPPPLQLQQQQYRPPAPLSPPVQQLPGRPNQRPVSPSVPPRDHYYTDRPAPGPSLPSGPRHGGNTVPPPRSPIPPHLVQQAHAQAEAHSQLPSPQAAIMSQAGESLSREQLVQLFRDLDKQGNGYVTEVQLAETLVNGDATKFDPVTVNMMVRMFDSNRNGELEFEEFVGLWRFLEKWCDIFNKFDADHSGTISLAEFKAALVSFQYRLSDTFIEFIFRVYDHGHKGVITFDIFMQSCITLKRMTDIFKKYDDDRDGFIIINFEDFVTEFLRQLQKMTAPMPRS